MIAALGLKISEGFRRTAPDPFVLAVLLTVVTLVLVLVRTDMGFDLAVRTWAGTEGVWSAGLLKFAMQMCLILVTGHTDTTATSPTADTGRPGFPASQSRPRDTGGLLASA